MGRADFFRAKTIAWIVRPLGPFRGFRPALFSPKGGFLMKFQD
jgi:hypothetical protein